ncbi:hypothetical protein PHMEG_00012948 [Phytophthora megakarya]|uniref:Uncharacterized protein n=1 Tax=Phytophthora megakarya TaxID=4795 RepID=A0A225W901_9STRA|nr:hypothetical protein PHMEG_00012948 [Phytophthora megakarya]
MSMDFPLILQRWGIFRKLRTCFENATVLLCLIKNIRNKITSDINERKLRVNVQTNDATGSTLNVLCVIVKHLIAHADVATGLKPVQDAGLLAMMHHTFDRAIDTYFARKHQPMLSSCGELWFKYFPS